MKFLHPAFLYALSALAIPVIIHLFNFRKFKKLYFTNVRFLREVKQETQSRSRLKHLLVLISRLLALAFLVFAFARPYIPSEQGKETAGKKVVGIYIDNSFSMETTGENGSLLEEAKTKAVKIAGAYDVADEFTLITNDFKAKHQRLLNREQLIDYIENIELSPAVKKQTEMYSRMKEIMSDANARHRHLYFLSDFQKLTADLKHFPADSGYFLNLHPLEGIETSNLYIDSCWFTSPVRQYQQPEKLKVRIQNNSTKKYQDVPVSLKLNGRPKTPATLSIGPEEEKELTLTYTNTQYGIQQGVISIEDYPVTFDDKFYFSYEVLKEINILSIYEERDRPKEEGLKEIPPLQRLFGKDSLFNFTRMKVDQMDYSLLKTSQAVIINEIDNLPSGLSRELIQFVNTGGSVVVFPGTDLDFNSYRGFLSSMGADQYQKVDTNDTEVDQINLNHPLFSGVFEKVPENLNLPIVDRYYQISSISRTSRENILNLRNGRDFFNEYPYGKGKLYLSAVPMDSEFSNFTNHAVFVPLLYNIGLYSSKTQKLFYTVGKPNTISLNHQREDENIYHLKGEGLDLIPEIRVRENKPVLYVHDQVRKAGNYLVTYRENQIKGISFNFDRKESKMEFYQGEELEDQLKKSGISDFKILDIQGENITQKVSILNEGQQLWKLCIILALVFVGIEVLLLKFWKT